MSKYILCIFLFVLTIESSDVYFTKEISPEKVVEMFDKLDIELTGNIGIKVHTGESGGKYFLRPSFLQKIYDYLNAIFIECNAAYTGTRHNTSIHKQTLKDNGWLDNNRRTVIMDEDPEKDWKLSITNSNIINENIVGGRLKEFDSVLVMSHLKGHRMGGFGGALKQLSIGFASRAGKAWIHTAGETNDHVKMWNLLASQENFTAAMGDAAFSIVNYFKNKGGKIVFINVLTNITTRCDCEKNAPEPKIKDIGILASTDPVAIDRASIDMIINSTIENGTQDWLTQLKNLQGENTIYSAEKLGLGTQEYNIIDVDDESSGNNEKDGEEIEYWIYIGTAIVILIIVIGIIIAKKVCCPSEIDPNSVDKITDE